MARIAGTRTESIVRRRQRPESGGLGTFLQIMLVGALLFAVIWQVRGSVDPEAPGRVTVETYVTTDEVNLRSGPGLDQDVLAVLPLHTEVEITGPAKAGFLPVDVDGAAAWISSDYLVREGSVLAGTSGDVPVLEAAELEEAPLPNMLVANVSAAEVDAPPEPEPVVDEEPPQVTETVAQETVEDEPVDVAPPVEEPAERWIEVDRSTATVILHEGERIVAQYDGLIGKDPSPDGYYATAVGTFHVYVKERALAETPFAPGVFLTDFVGFDPARSNGFHSPVRDAAGQVVQTGGTATLGCVRLAEDEARFLFDFVDIGTRVEIHD